MYGERIIRSRVSWRAFVEHPEFVPCDMCGYATGQNYRLRDTPEKDHFDLCYICLLKFEAGYLKLPIMDPWLADERWRISVGLSW